MIAAANLDPVVLEAMEDAALVESFDPVALAGRDAERGPAILAELAPLSEEVWTPGPLAWRLRSDARQAFLGTLAGTVRLEAALQRHADETAPFSRYLVGALGGAALPGPPASAPEREAAIIAYEIATASLAGVASRESALGAAREGLASLRAQAALEAERLRSETILSGPLIGRKPERAALVHYIESGAPLPGDALQLPPAGAAQLPLRPFLITGCAGAGKSALLADIIRERRQPGTPGSVLLLDFDRPSVCRGGPGEWSSELTRQLGLGNPVLTQRLQRLRHAAAALAPASPSGDVAIAGAIVAEEIRKNLAPALLEEQAAGAPLLVVLDTFEEVLTRSDMSLVHDTLFSDVLRWAAELADIRHYENPGIMAFSTVRVIVSGRIEPDLGEDLSAWFCGRKVIGTLDDAAAREFLKLRDRDKRLSADQIGHAVKVVGGHPLSLILFERFVRQQPDAIDEVLGQGDLSRVMTGEEAARTLYSRFLLRLNVEERGGVPVDPEKVRRIAHPGLVLREVNADHIRDIIAPGCGVPLAPGEEKQLFDRLTDQVWLVEEVRGRTPRTVRHRADVRRLMLPMMSGKAEAKLAQDGGETLGEQVGEVRRLAADWFKAQSTVALDDAAVEAAYHRAFLDEIPDVEDAALWKRVWNLAPDDVPAMPPGAAALVRYHGRGASSLSREQTEALPEALRSSAAVEQTSESIMAGRIGEAAASAELVQPIPPIPPEPHPPGARGGPPIPPSTLPPLYVLARDRALAAEVDSAFHSGNYARAAAIGWGAIMHMAEGPLDEPLPIEEDITSHWLWRAALARMVSPQEAPDVQWLEDRLHALLAPDRLPRTTLTSAGLVLAAAIYIGAAGRGRIPDHGVEGLAALAERTKYLERPGDARLLTLAAVAANRELTVFANARAGILPDNVPPEACEGPFHFPSLAPNRRPPYPDPSPNPPIWQMNEAYYLLNARLPELATLVVAIAMPAIQSDTELLLGAVERLQPQLPPAIKPLELDPDYLRHRLGDRLASHSAIAATVASADAFGLLPAMAFEFRRRSKSPELAQLHALVSTYAWLLGAEFA
jgi:hypothetical protein